ncbi:MAG: class I SAM-dependent rRNA methyltransferase [Verrucomicrobiales bacterium]
MPGLIVNPRSRIFHGHDWVYASEIKKVFGDPQPGDVISLKDFKDRPLGSAIYNPNSQIVARRFSRRSQKLDLDFFRRRLGRALDYRRGLALDPADYCRIVWSESDGLPGVIVDRYGDYLALQTNTLAMDTRRDLITEALVDLIKPTGIVERNESPVRVPEGLPPRAGMLHGPEPSPWHVDFDGISLTIDLIGGQKTGVYLDQWGHYAVAGAHAAGCRVLDCFSNQGGFALACAAAGAASVTALETSTEALEAGRANAGRCGLDVDFIEANVFDYLKEAERASERYGLIILDPPPFARSKKNRRDALRGYKEINLRALKLLEPGGVLLTFSCSYHVSAPDLLEVVASASVDAKRNVRRLRNLSQRLDHPVIATIPESEYLQGFVFQTLAAW